jgi:hypothetical protein
MAGYSAATTTVGTAQEQAAMAQARWLGLGGAVLWLYAAWAPWAIVILHRTLVAPEPYISPAGLSQLGLVPFALSPVLLGIITPLGLLLCPWLWSRRFRVPATGAFMVWVALMSLVTLITLIGLGFALTPLPFSLLPPTGAGLSLDFGLLLALAVLALLWIAAIRLWRAAADQVRRVGLRRALQGERRERAPQDAPAAVFARVGLITGGAGSVTAGVVIWALSYFFMPWVLGEPCPENLIVVGCSGLSAADTTALAATPAGAFLDPRIFLYAFPILLGTSALMTIYAVQRLPINVPLCLWLACWLALVSATVALGWIGRTHLGTLSGVTASPAISITPAGAVAALGAGVGWLGFIPLLLAALSARREQAKAS